MACYQDVTPLGVLYNLGLLLRMLPFSGLPIALLGGLVGDAHSEVVGRSGVLCLAGDSQTLSAPVFQSLLHRRTFQWSVG